MQYSDEQAFIIESCVKDNNVIVDAVAGSGKTTTMLGIAEALPNKLVLGVLYNRSLKEEVRDKAAKRELINLEVHNYHALAKKYYDESIHDDQGILKAITENKPPKKALPRWGRFVLDEVQDMSPTYFSLICKVIVDLNNPDLKLTVMGDRFQSIYEYMNSDSRFLTHAEKLYKPVKGNWVHATLSVSYRCSQSICSFINDCLLGYKRMTSGIKTPSTPVNYIHGNSFEVHSLLVTLIKTHIRCGAKPDDIFVLVPSTKVSRSNTPAKLLENALVDEQLPVFVPTNEVMELNSHQESPTNGKIVITTYHQSKGLERDIVIVYSFDESYNQYYNKDGDQNMLSAAMYVALTRARKQLYVLHDRKSAPLNFFAPPRGTYVKFMTTRGVPLIGLPQTTAVSTGIRINLRKFNASQLTDYLTPEAVMEARAHFSVQIIKPPRKKAPMVSIIQTETGLFEAVSDINGIAIPALHEWRKRKSVRILNLDRELIANEGIKFMEQFVTLQKSVSSTEEPPLSSLLHAANIFSAVMSGYHHKVAQIKDYTWLATHEVESCMEILDKHLHADDIQYEVILPEQVVQENSISGQVDAYSEKLSTLWEIKCTDELDSTHEIQLAVYAWMYSRAHPKRFNEISFILVNIRPDECRRISASAPSFHEMMCFLMAEKNRTPRKQSDENFISEYSVKFDTIKPAKRQLTIPNMMLEPPKTLLIQEEPAVTTPPMRPRRSSATYTNLPANVLVDIQMERPHIIVFDLETNGLPLSPGFGKYHPPTEIDKYRTSRIVQWSWSVHDKEGNTVAEEDHIVRPNLAEYRIQNEQFHGISEAKARIHGISFDDVLTKFKSYLDNADILVGHNVNFDKNVLLAELYRRGYQSEADTLLSRTWHCTMERSTQLCGLKASNKTKPPKLRELMHALGIAEEKGRAFHNSKHDVYYTAKCYFAEQVLKNPCPKMYEGKYAGLTFEEILKRDRHYVAHAHASCNVRKLYNSPLRKLSNWVKPLLATDPDLAHQVAMLEQTMRVAETN